MCKYKLIVFLALHTVMSGKTDKRFVQVVINGFIEAAFCRNWHFVRFSAHHTNYVVTTQIQGVSQSVRCNEGADYKQNSFIIMRLCVENLHFDVNMYVTLRSYPLTQVTQCRNN